MSTWSSNWDRPWVGEPDELHRHSRALEQAPPDFAREHIAEVAFDRVELDGSIAIFYRIAGETLHGYRPIGAFQQQSDLQTIFSVVNREVLARWNSVAASFDQAVHPQSLLPRWLTYRLEPQGHIEKFLEEVCRIDADRPGLLVQGRVYPNPLLFARDANPWGRARVIDAVVGFQHGDMNLNNILVRFSEDGAELEGYFLIDFAFFEERMPLLYDQAYLEMSFLLPYVSTVDSAKWVDLVTSFADRDIPDPQRVPIELAGAAAAVSAGRREFDRWVRENHISLTDDLWGQFSLAATAAGLNYCGKGALSDQQRLAGLIFSAAHLKRYCEKFNVSLPVDVAHLYEASHVTDEPKGSTVVRRSYRLDTSNPRHNLPVQLTSFIGREDELVEINNLLFKAPLITLTGSGGAGKTRLAQEIGAGNVEAYPDGVWFVGLAPLSDPKLIPGEVASALDVGEDALHDFLREKSTLLIVDNCEHLLDECAEFASKLLQQAPEVKILATSREALGIPGEVIYRVPSLSVPDSLNQSLGVLADYEAVLLFADRAAAVLPGFALTDRIAPAVAQITQRLDGIPLAIELAAARVNVLSAEQIAGRLDDLFRLLTMGRRTAVPRHQTLRSTLEWSYQLLSEAECLLFNRLSVFRGGFTLEAAEQTCSRDGLESFEVLDVLSQLVDKSLVVVEQGSEGGTRYRLLETLRQYGAERLAETDEVEDMRRRHASFFLKLAQEAEPKLRGPEQVLWFEKLDNDYDNILAVMGWSLESDEVETALRMGAALLMFWITHPHVAKGEASDRLEKALSAGGDVPPDARAGALLSAGWMVANDLADFQRANTLVEESLELWKTLGVDAGVAMAQFLMCFNGRWSGDLEGAKGHVETALRLFQRVEDPWGVAFCHFYEGVIAGVLGEHEKAEDLLTTGLEEFREINDSQGTGWCLIFRGHLALVQADYERAATLCADSIPHFRQAGQRAYLAGALVSLGTVAWLQGDHTRAAQLQTAGLTVLKEMGDRGIVLFISALMVFAGQTKGDVEREVGCHRERLNLTPDQWANSTLSVSLYSLGKLVRQQGDLGRALALLKESLALAYRVSDKGGLALVLLESAGVVCSQGDFERAAQLLGVVKGLSEAVEDFLLPDEWAMHRQLVNQNRTQLGDEVFDPLFNAGIAMVLDDAVAYATA